MLDNKDYCNLPALPPAAKEQLDSMIGKEIWDLNDDQRTWLYMFCLYDSYQAACQACGGNHKPIECTTPEFTFSEPNRKEAFACPITGDALWLDIGSVFGQTRLTLRPQERLP